MSKCKLFLPCCSNQIQFCREDSFTLHYVGSLMPFDSEWNSLNEAFHLMYLPPPRPLPPSGTSLLPLITLLVFFVPSSQDCHSHLWGIKLSSTPYTTEWHWRYRPRYNGGGVDLTSRQWGPGGRVHKSNDKLIISLLFTSVMA